MTHVILKSLVKRTWVRWCAAAAGLVVIAFVSGFAFGLFDSTGIEAQSDAHPQDTILDPSMVVTPVRRIPEMDTSLNPVTVHRGTRRSDSDAGSGSTATEGATGRLAANAAGRSTRPEGRYLHLPRIGRYYSLPDDVVLMDTYITYSCPLHPDTRCPAPPVYIYKRGDAEIGIDSKGEIFTNWPEADASAFPFFTGGN